MMYRRSGANLARLCEVLLISAAVVSGCALGERVRPTPTSAPTAVSASPVPATATPAPRRTPVPRGSLSATEVRALGAALESIEGAQVAAWNSHDVEAVRAVYTDDIVHHDAQPLYVGIDSVLAMVRSMFRDYPELGGRLAGAYIGREEGLGVWELWNVFRFTQESPGFEYDLLETGEGRISYWTLFYDPSLLNESGCPRINAKLSQDYAAAWSSADAETVARLYTETAVRYDSMFLERQEGRAAIQSFAASFFEAFPGVAFELVEPFGECAPGTRLGGVYALRVTDDFDQPCTVRMAVLLEPSAGSIASERVYYDAESLISCSWAR